jgi:uncharacterized protein (DUF2249 family)
MANLEMNATQPKSCSTDALVLDVRPIFAQGATPCSAIDQAVSSLTPGQLFVLLAPFEPAPLFSKLAALGFSHRSEPASDGTWRIEFTPGPNPVAPGSIATGSCCGH